MTAGVVPQSPRSAERAGAINRGTKEAPRPALGYRIGALRRTLGGGTDTQPGLGFLSPILMVLLGLGGFAGGVLAGLFSPIGTMVAPLMGMFGSN